MWRAGGHWLVNSALCRRTKRQDSAHRDWQTALTHPHASPSDSASPRQALRLTLDAHNKATILRFEYDGFRRSLAQLGPEFMAVGIVVDEQADQARTVEFLHEAVEECHSFGMREVLLSPAATSGKTSIMLTLRALTPGIRLLSLAVWGVGASPLHLAAPAPPADLPANEGHVKHSCRGGSS